MALRFFISVLLVAAVCGIYAQTAQFDFVNYDDPQLYENPRAAEGLTADGLRWAFTAIHVGNYIPVTLLTYLADAQRAGMTPGAFHVTNVVFHAANAVLLFLALFVLTGRTWPSALVAALFAVHPLHVESVAWVSERKDVVSTFFGLLALITYAVYVRRPRMGMYALMMALLAGSLFSKAMLVTFPFLLLVLDFWPLQRRESWKRLVWEKVPLLALVALVSGITLYVQHTANALPPSDFLGWWPRVGNAIASYGRYLVMTAVPRDLIPYYPHPGAAIPLWQVAGAGTALIIVSGVAWALRRRTPYLLAGWFWYLGTLVPVIGIVQVGGQALADRYTYLPLIGIFVAVAWALAHVADRLPRARYVIAPAAVALLALLATLAYQQSARWRDSITLYKYTLSVDPKNPVALPNLAEAYLSAGRYEDAAITAQRALQVTPGNAGVHGLLGLALQKLGRPTHAEPHLREAVRLDPDSAKTHANLAQLLLEQNRVREARVELERARAIDPADASTLVNLGNVSLREGNLGEAEARYRDVLARNPRNPDALSNLSAVHLMRQEYGQAEARARESLALRPDDATTRTNLAVALMELGKADQARREAEAALRADPAYEKAKALLAELDHRAGR